MECLSKFVNIDMRAAIWRNERNELFDIKNYEFEVLKTKKGHYATNVQICKDVVDPTTVGKFVYGFG